MKNTPQSHGITGKPVTHNYGRCSLCRRQIPSHRGTSSHYCSATCADLVRRYGYAQKPPRV